MKKSKRVIRRIRKVQELINNDNVGNMCTHKFNGTYTLASAPNGKVLCTKCNTLFTLIDSTDEITTDNMNDAIHTILSLMIQPTKKDLINVKKLEKSKDLIAISKLLIVTQEKFDIWDKSISMHQPYGVNNRFTMIPYPQTLAEQSRMLINSNML